MKRTILTTIMCTLAITLSLPRVCASFSDDKDNQEARETYRAYVMAWKVKDLGALRKLISDDYMAVNFEGKLSDKENEISTAEEDAEWNSMTVDEIHTRIFGDTADGNRNVLGRKIHDFLFNIVFKDAEVLGFEACDEPVVRIRYDDVDERQLHIHVDGLALRNNVSRCVVLDITLDVRLGRGGPKE